MELNQWKSLNSSAGGEVSRFKRARRVSDPIPPIDSSNYERTNPMIISLFHSNIERGDIRTLRWVLEHELNLKRSYEKLPRAIMLL